MKENIEVLENSIAEIYLDMEHGELKIPENVFNRLKEFGDPQTIIIELLTKAIAKYQ